MKTLYATIIVIIAIAVGATVLAIHQSENLYDLPSGQVSTSTPVTALPEDQISLSIGEKGVLSGISIEPISISEDSRCPMDVQCIQAGTVKVLARVTSPTGNGSDTFTLGKMIPVGNVNVTLAAVTPEKQSTKLIATDDYVFTFKVETIVSPEPVTTTPGSSVATGECYVGGCSSQICSDEPGIVSTCIYSPSFACYKTATCERQTSGQCGWTETAELEMCLENAS